MDITQANSLFNALSQETRLRAFRRLVRAGPGGMAAGALSEALGTPHNTLSFHLQQLTNAGIVTSRRNGRSIIYSADFRVMRELIGFLIKDCCSDSFATIREDPGSGCSIIELGDPCGTGTATEFSTEHSE